MSKKVLSVALLVVLGTMAVGCQKENITELRPETSISETGTVTRCSTPLTAYCTQKRYTAKKSITLC